MPSLPASHNRSLPTEGQVGVGEEGLGAGQLLHPACHVEQRVLVLQISNLASSLALLARTKVDPENMMSRWIIKPFGWKGVS